MTHFKFVSCKGFTLVEILIGMTLSIFVLFGAYNFMSSTSHQYMHGTVNLQNFKDVHLALNYLRRDFSCACPRLNYPPKLNVINPDADAEKTAYKNFIMLRKQLFDSKNDIVFDNHVGELVQIPGSSLLFHKFVFSDSNQFPQIKKVLYVFDPESGILTRQAEGEGKQEFTGFNQVNFSLYVNDINKAVPMLHVTFVVHEGVNTYGTEEIGKPLEISTSIVSNYMVSLTRNAHWRSETGHMATD